MTLLEVRALSVTMRGASLVRNVALALERGQCTALVGESGSGKTQTALALLGLSPPGAVVHADVAFEGVAVEPASLRGRVVYMPQDPLAALNPVLRIGTQLDETIRSRGSARTPSELLAAVGLPASVTSAFAHELSGGMRQRALLALCLAASPRVLMVDEPTTALDASTRGQLVSLLHDLVTRDGLSVLLITHDLQVAERLAQHVAVMYAGEVVEVGQDVLTNPRHPYTRALLRARPSMTSGVLPTSLAGHVPSPTERGRGCPFQPRCSLASARCRVEAPQLVHGVACHEVSST